MKSRILASSILIGLAAGLLLFAHAPVSAQFLCGYDNDGCCQNAPKCIHSTTFHCNTTLITPARPYGTCVANTTPPQNSNASIELTNPLGGTSDVRSLIERFVTILRDFATPIAVFMILLGAFRILTAAGDPAKFETGKKILLYTAIGYAIIFVGWGITSIIESLLST